MASITRVRISYFLANFGKILTKKSFNLNKNQQALFHCSNFLNVKGQEIKMPSLSPTMAEGKIVKWLKKEGDTINPGDVLCDIETDKAVVSMEIEEEGILAKIIVPENSQQIKVGELIALMVSEGEDWKNVDVPSGTSGTISSSSSSSSLSSSSSSSSSDSQSDTEGVKKVETREPRSGGSDIPSQVFGPAVKALLSNYQLKPNSIQATGKNNRLLKEDVMKYIEDNKLKKVPVSSVSAPSQPPAAKQKIAKKQTQVLPKTGPKYKDIELTNMRQVIAKRLLQSKKEIPHSYSTVKCDVAQLLEAKDIFSSGIKVSVNDLLTKATALALQVYPKANALYINNEVKLSQSVDISVAVATNMGLFTPIIRSTNLKSVPEISKEIRELAEKAKNGKLKPEEFQGGTFTISNLGMFGVTHFKAIINPPQCGILAIGGTIESLNSNLAVCKHIILSLSYDRRALEEHEAGVFMETLKYIIENPKLIMLTSNHNFPELSL